MKILITGITGFVAGHFLHYLSEMEPGSEVMGFARHAAGFNPSEYPTLNIKLREIDLLNREAVETAIKGFRPEYVLHLASVSSVAHSWQMPLESFVNNTNIFLNLVEEIRLENIPCRVLSVGSSEEYGDVPESELPLTESHTLQPVSPYAVARVSQELLSVIYAKGYKQDIVITRSFNHIGPGQSDKFVISSFARQLVQLATNGDEQKVIRTGDLSIIRDFLDVRDVVKAYYALLKSGKSGEIYNICSGRGIVLKELISLMSAALGINTKIEIDPSRIRPNDNRKIVGSNKKIREEIGWSPAIPLEQSVRDMIQYWQERQS